MEEKKKKTKETRRSSSLSKEEEKARMAKRNWMEFNGAAFIRGRGAAAHNPPTSLCLLAGHCFALCRSLSWRHSLQFQSLLNQLIHSQRMSWWKRRNWLGPPLLSLHSITAPKINFINFLRVWLNFRCSNRTVIILFSCFISFTKKKDNFNFLFAEWSVGIACLWLLPSLKNKVFQITGWMVICFSLQPPKHSTNFTPPSLPFVFQSINFISSSLQGRLVEQGRGMKQSIIDCGMSCAALEGLRP